VATARRVLSQRGPTLSQVLDLAALADFETVKGESRLLSPLRLFGLGRLINRFLAPFPIVNSLCLRHYTVCRSLRRAGARQ
jgi:hypothetical protein